MTSSIEDGVARRRARADVVAFTMGRGRFRLLVFGVVAAVGAAFAGGLVLGRSSGPGTEAAIPVPVTADAEPESKPAPAPKPAEAKRPAPAMELARIGGDKAEAASEAETVRDDAPQADDAQEPPPVRVTIRDDEPPDGFGLQLGAFESREEAIAFVEAHAIALDDRRVHVITTQVPGKGTWHRVRVGHFDNKRIARRARRNMTDELRSTSIVVKYR